MNFTRYVLVYPDGQVAGLDSASGGYPFRPESNCVGLWKFWATKKEADSYCKMFPELTVTAVEFEVKGP
jgi:hypothetical protein